MKIMIERTSKENGKVIDRIPIRVALEKLERSYKDMELVKQDLLDGNRVQSCFMFYQKAEQVEQSMKVGDEVICYDNEKYKVIEISNDFEEISSYDSSGACRNFIREMNLAEDNFDETGCDWFVAVKHLKSGDHYVFGISHGSNILGE